VSKEDVRILRDRLASLTWSLFWLPLSVALFFSFVTFTNAGEFPVVFGQWAACASFLFGIVYLMSSRWRWKWHLLFPMLLMVWIFYQNWMRLEAIRG
jgi:hypothetical protein